MASQSAASAAPGNTMPAYILVVEDDEGMRHALRTYLDSLGYEVRTAVNGTEALRLIARRKPDLMILDLLMEEMSGWEVLETLRSSDATWDIRVLVLTGLSSDSHEAKGWFLGCDWYEIKKKPLQFDDIGLVVERLLAIDPHEERRIMPQT
ncbi:MAG: response regulator [Armatimonadetes bacterium]|nr:response regulator [Armatimonadota bacterium]